jgi:hypothetical protein
MAGMTGITIKLSEASLKRLRQRARATGKSVAALVREHVDTATADRDNESVYALSADLAGSAAGKRQAATNARRRFHRA